MVASTQRAQKKADYSDHIPACTLHVLTLPPVLSFFFSESEAGATLKRCWLSGHPDMSETEAVDLIQSRAKSILQENLSRFGISLEKCASSSNTATAAPSNETLHDEGRDNVNAEIPIAEDATVEEKSISARGVISINKTDSDQPIIDRSSADSFSFRRMNRIDISVAKQDLSPTMDGGSIPKSSDVGREVQHPPMTEKSNLSEESGSGGSNDEKSIDIAAVITTPSNGSGLDDFDEILMNMSRVSITPHSNTDTPPVVSISKEQRRISTEKNRLDLALTKSQLDEIFDDDSNSPTSKEGGRKGKGLSLIFAENNLPVSLAKSEVDLFRSVGGGSSSKFSQVGENTILKSCELRKVKNRE